MTPILQVTAPFFGLVLVGWACVRLRWLPAEAIPGLNGFVLFFALPAMLLRFAATTPIAQLLDAGLVAVFAVVALALVALAFGGLRRAGLKEGDAAFLALVAAFPNSGFMGVPLLVALLGTAAAAPAIVALAFDMVVTSSLCIALAAGAAGGDTRRALAGSAARILRNPLPWAIGLGTAVSAAGVPLPGMVEQTIALLATAASPVALFALGGLLARRSAPAPHRRAPGPDAAVAGIVLGKLVMHPLLMFAAGRAALALGVPLDPFAADVLVLVAALPSASNVPMLAERLGADGARVARVVLGTTVGAFASFTAAVALLGPAAAR